MSKTTDPIKLLILDDSQKRAEDLVTLLRNAGRATRAQQILTEDELLSFVKDSAWDLFLCRSESNGITAQQCLHAVQNMEKDIPFIIMVDDDNPVSITEGLKIGAKDVALASDTDRLVIIIERELDNLEHRRAKRKAEIDLHETDKRNQLLLDTSTAAIAYVHDGMHIYTNNAYATLFGYLDPDDFAGIPIIDLISSDDQEKFKKLLKSHEDELEVSDEFTCVTSEGEHIQSNLSMSQATYEEEACTQVIFKVVSDDSELEERIREISSQDLLTGLYNRQYFNEKLDGAVDQAVKNGQSSVLFYIDTDQFSRVRAEAGIANADIILTDIANVLKMEISEPHVLARFGEDVYTLLYMEPDKEKAEAFANELRKKVEAQIFEVSGKTFQVTIRIGLALISESTSSGEDALAKSSTAAGEIEGGNSVKFHQPKAIKVSEDGESLSSENIKALLKTALKENKFKLFFTPIISLQGDDEGQFEVTSLMQVEEVELLPEQFRAEAEELKILHTIDRLIVRESIKSLTIARKQGSKARLFIGISPNSAADDTFLSWISVALKAARLPSDSIIFQIHENDAHSYIKHVKKFMTGLTQLHCKSAISNYGCALNPQNVFKHLSPDYVRIDSSFVEEVDSDDKKKSELLALLKTLQSKGIMTSISGVESPMVLPVMFESGVNYIQGDYVSGPLETLDYDFSEEM